ncbi:MAG: DUF1801 domain-containing protein [Actinomycetota bacterium]|nr:DUF1801 domain-containing protein [Actinomycetota bacterium]
MDDAVQRYLDAIAADHRPLFDRLHNLILEEYPAATLALSYRIPCYRAGGGRLYVGVWKHGLSVYGWQQGSEAGFVSRHPELRTSKGTIQLSPEAAAGLPDSELRELVRLALGRPAEADS